MKEKGGIFVEDFGKAEANTKIRNYWNVPLRDSLLFCWHVLPVVNICIH